MPMYDYTCEACGEKVEKMRKVSARDRDFECPILCCEGRMRRNVSAPKAVHGGFYDNIKSGGSNL
ncbi:FmdB family regulatory protein [Citrobacter phage CkP1]|nr:FmdB family regulatory protein [Citrobacter phage CkP1]